MKFNTGNVFKLDYSLCIVTGERTVNDRKITDWISFSHENTSGSTPNKTENITELCFDCSTNVLNEPDYECEKCKGTGEYKGERSGMDKAIFLASNVESYIKSRLLKNFEF